MPGQEHGPGALLHEVLRQDGRLSLMEVVPRHGQRLSALVDLERRSLTDLRARLLAAEEAIYQSADGSAGQLGPGRPGHRARRQRFLSSRHRYAWSGTRKNGESAPPSCSVGLPCRPRSNGRPTRRIFSNARRHGDRTCCGVLPEPTAGAHCAVADSVRPYHSVVNRAWWRGHCPLSGLCALMEELGFSPTRPRCRTSEMDVWYGAEHTHATHGQGCSPRQEGLDLLHIGSIKSLCEPAIGLWPAAERRHPACPAAATADSGWWRLGAPVTWPVGDGPCRGPSAKSCSASAQAWRVPACASSNSPWSRCSSAS